MNVIYVLNLCFLLWGPGLRAASIDVPQSSTSGSISYATDGLYRLRGTLVPLAEIFELEDANRVLFSETKLQKDLLRKVKYLLMNGETTLAKVHLSKLALTQTPLRPIIYRYLAILHFFEGRFDRTYYYLEQPELSVIPHFSKICPLKILSQIVLNKTLEMESDWARCRIQHQGMLVEDKVI